ncbi:MAG: PAS domain-containing protein [Parcubacteria group bacterium]|nr:PAS domain-containing protein [Parcubacteria group bacterium]
MIFNLKKEKRETEIRDSAEFARKAKSFFDETAHVLKKIAIDDYSDVVAIPPKEDEFTETRVALNILIANLNERDKLKQEAEEIRARAAVEETAKRQLAEKAALELGEKLKEISEINRALEETKGAVLNVVGDIKEKEAQLVEEKQKLRFALEEAEKSSLELKEKIQRISDLNASLESTKGALLNVVDDVKTREVQLRQEREKLRVTLASIGDGAFVVDAAGAITFFNPMAEKLSRVNASDVMGKRYKEALKFVREKDMAEDYGFIDDVLTSGRAGKMKNNMILVAKDGAKIAVADSSSPIFDQTGGVSGCIVVFRDVGKERELDRVKSEFISIASHQLRTPLTSIRWYSEVLLEETTGKLSAEQKDLLKNSYEATLQMADLINALLNLSRIESERLTIKPEPVNIEEFVAVTIKELEPLNLKFEKGHEIVFNKPPAELPLLNIDRKMLHEILSNLISNSIKYTPPKGKITVEANVKDGSVVFSVKDNGLGIPASQQSRIFDKFFRADNITILEFGGTGLGLYIVKRLIETLNGKIWFESVEGKGTTFFFSLPAAGVAERIGEVGLV